MSNQDQYLGNPNLKKTNTAVEFTKEDIQEYHKCAEDPFTFRCPLCLIALCVVGLVTLEVYYFL